MFIFKVGCTSIGPDMSSMALLHLVSYPDPHTMVGSGHGEPHSGHQCVLEVPVGTGVGEERECDLTLMGTRQMVTIMITLPPRDVFSSSVPKEKLTPT